MKIRIITLFMCVFLLSHKDSALIQESHLYSGTGRFNSVWLEQTSAFFLSVYTHILPTARSGTAVTASMARL